MNSLIAQTGGGVSEEYGLQAKSYQLPVFINKVLWEHN